MCSRVHRVEGRGTEGIVGVTRATVDTGLGIPLYSREDISLMWRPNHESIVRGGHWLSRESPSVVSVESVLFDMLCSVC